MRSLAQPEVLQSAGTAAVLSSLACLPRLWLWPHRRYDLWYLEATMFLGSTVLWAFVFAWHTKYTQRPVFALKPGLVPFLLATLCGVAAAVFLHLWLDPSLRLRTPEDYPRTIMQWIALVLFSLAFNQLFLVFAPFAWAMRLFRSTRMAALLTILFGVFVLVLKNRSSPTPMPSALLPGLLVVRVVVGALSVYFFLRGGVLLVWWWGLLLQTRHLWKPE
jgi:hypothetical protein